MGKYFQIHLEFNKREINRTITDAIQQGKKGYVCVVDGNVMTNAHRDSDYKKIINNSLVNICDGSSIAIIAGIIHNEQLRPYTGPEIFSYFISKDYKHFFLGNTGEVLKQLKRKFEVEKLNSELMEFLPLPFEDVNNFEYESIAEKINKFSPDIVWVSLGAPKQEKFISILYNYLGKGILFGIGAAFNLYLDDKKFKRAPEYMQKMHMEWLYRSITEPKRIGTRALRYLLILPKLIINEILHNNPKLFQKETSMKV